MSFLDALPQRYRLILCDIWGCVHDGQSLLPGAAERLRQWRGEGRFVCLITNAPRTADAVEQHLLRLGLRPDAWDAIVTSGEAGIAALLQLDKPVGFLGTAEDRAILEGRGLVLANRGFFHLAATGLDDERPSAEQYRQQLQSLVRRRVTFHCLNPDRLVIHCGERMVCAGALADIYEALGGIVAWYGKPHPPIYREALALAGNPPAEAVLAIGDGLPTDIAGAAAMGFDVVFVRGGIHADEPVPDDYGTPGWAPVAVVPSLA
ncbi:MAG: TIGR01459 family HAD-type hydrolase [Pseudomonadota bacterium]|nr:TIGR01459 family HAD-type hydrolase [Pseudomonadota bacterium]